jgi:hypothetical protein
MVNSKLVGYEYVPSGFEMVINNPDIEMGKVWNLWYNVKLTDDPEAWDAEIKSINKIQGKLERLTLDQRLIRAQIAEFCREHPSFPGSVDILCKEIGEGRFSNPVKIGCEGRGLLDSLGYHDGQSLNDQRKEILIDYARSLEKWLAQSRLEKATETKVCGFLGQPTNSKKAFVEKLISVIDSEEPSISSLKRLSENECAETHGKTILATLEYPRPLHCFNCPEGFPEGATIPNCQICAYSMIIDAGLLCTGTFGEKGQIVNEYIRFTEEYILAYAIAINSWLKEARSKHVTSLITPHYFTDNASEIVERVNSSLGEKDEAKEWLAACLLKTIKDNQRWHKRTELIDSFPEAFSWFRQLP